MVESIVDILLISDVDFQFRKSTNTLRLIADYFFHLF